MKNTLIMLMICLSVTGCGDHPKVGEYASPKTVWGWIQHGDVFCYNQSDNEEASCTAVEYPNQVGKDQATILQVSLLDEVGQIKKQSTQKLKLTKDGICVTSTLDQFDSMLFFKTGSMHANITNEDKSVSLEKQKAAIELFKRVYAPTIGTTTCYKHLVTKLAPNGDVSEIQEHAFVDGIRQTRERDSLITFFSIAYAKNNLALRPVDTSQTSQQKNASEKNVEFSKEETLTDIESKVDESESLNSETATESSNQSSQDRSDSAGQTSYAPTSIKTVNTSDSSCATSGSGPGNIAKCGYLANICTSTGSGPGNDVSCGGLANICSSTGSGPGNKVACGGQSNICSSTGSGPGNDVACGGLANICSSTGSGPGNKVACGGQSNICSSTGSGPGNDVACGGLANICSSTGSGQGAKRACGGLANN